MDKADCCYIPISEYNNDEDDSFNTYNNLTICDFDPKLDNVDRFLIEYGRDSSLVKILFSLLLLNPLFKLLVSGTF